jgi:hypothetical protein
VIAKPVLPATLFVGKSISLASALSQTGLRAISVHAGLVPYWQQTYEAACRETGWRPSRIDSYNPRLIRGSRQWSLHAVALAWDFFDKDVPVDVWGTASAPPMDWLLVWERAGFRLGAQYRIRKDYPHVEFWYPGLRIRK